MPDKPGKPNKPNRSGAHNKRDTSRTLVCVVCGTAFHPWLAKPDSKYCSRTCRSIGLMATINGTALSGPPPIRSEGLAPSQPTDHQAIQGTSQVIAWSAEAYGREWREAGEHWQRIIDWLNERRTAQWQRQVTQRADTGYHTIASEGRTLVLEGFNAGLFVKNGQLLVKQGTTYSTEPDRSEMLARGLHHVTDIIWLTNGGAGSLSVAALKWCASQNITVTILTHRGDVLAVVHPTADAPEALGIPGRSAHAGGRMAGTRPDVALRRAQYALAPSGRDVDVARQLLRRKIASQWQTVGQHTELPDRERALLATSAALDWLDVEPPPTPLTTLIGLRALEAKAARGYFGGWVGLPLRVDGKARDRWPAQWLTVAERNSPLTRWHGPRNATNPGQAMLNFCYTLLESQVRQALNVIGADVACGVLHADDSTRDSLVFDAVEPLRGLVDGLLLTMWRQHVFSAADFQANTAGVVQIHPTLRRVLIETCRLPQRQVDDEARWLRNLLLAGDARTPHEKDH